MDDTVTGPFGGEKNSGIGRFGDEWIIHEFTLEHWVTVRHSRTTYPF
jgi:aldehyde dehydrogenase (NAD+)